ncbi:MAG: hypothetical protein A2041_13900 [Bacteroidetes bacterium GWA2_31_9b]|nr:MAG: hypothetical protein A2041_13900 [Bacteroidetes bacterium GWA2_31_9b]
MKTLTNNKLLAYDKVNLASDNSKSKFLSHISHGIRTPLNSIMGFSKLLIDRELVDGKPKEYAQRIVTSSNVLLNFVENLIDLSQFDSNSYNFKCQQVNISQLFWEITEEFAYRKMDKEYSDVELIISEENYPKDFIINTDSDLLKKTVIKLIEQVATIYKNGKIELGYYVIHKNSLVKIFIRKINDGFINPFTHSGIYDDEEDRKTFDYFNSEVLNCSVSLLGGTICKDSSTNEYCLEIPII